MLPPIGPDPDPHAIQRIDGPRDSYQKQTLPAWDGCPAPVPRSYGAGIRLAMNEEAQEGHYALRNRRAFAPATVLAIPSPAYRLALATAGEVDVAIALTPGLNAYDIAAGHALLRAVGGEVVQKDGRPVSYGGEQTWIFHGCVGGRPELLPEVVRRVETLEDASDRIAG